MQPDLHELHDGIQISFNESDDDFQSISNKVLIVV